MKFRSIMIVLAIYVGTAGIFGAIEPAFANKDDTLWVSKIISVQGRVVVKRHGETEWKPVRLDDTLFAGDQMRVEGNSRAGIVLRNDAVLRLNQNTSLVFSEIEKETTFIFRLIKGAANFFSRRPRSLKILTPFVNGVVEGTEFLVQVDADQTRIDLFEGRLLAFNPHGEVQLSGGQGATATAESAPQRRLLARPRDSVQWALYYPPILAMGPDHISDQLRDAVEAFRQDRWLEALSNLEQLDEESRDAGFYAFRSALLLHQGNISQARNDIRQSLELDPENAEALSLLAVIAVVQNRSEEALKTAQTAVQSNPNSATARLALSYAHQARFDLPGALKAAQTAANLAPENGTARARLAELYLSTGQLDRGLKASRKAVALNPNESHAHALLGFAYLTQIKTQKAMEAFEKAIILDSAAPLPRLGLGLADIRNGDLESGRREIEIAVGLDPVNALMRSYLGKAYFDEKRGPLDEKQLEIAKHLDPNDPTPWFYDAIRKQTLNRPVEALRDLRKSIALNDNRAVYRSQLLLDEDLAARSAALGRLYNDLSFQEQALRQGYKSLGAEPSNYSAHRLLADVYASRPRHEIARVSELLQSQLQQPINLTPVQPQLAESNLMILEGAGPASSSFNEYNPLFVRDRFTLQASGVGGENNTRGDEVTVAGVEQHFSYSIGQMHYETDGFRDNNDLEQDIYNAFAQVALSPSSSLQLEYRGKKTENGDLRFLFDPDDFAAIYEEEREERSPRIGFRYSPKHNHHLLLSVIVNHETFERESESILGTNMFGPIVSSQSIDQKAHAYNGEMQYIYQGKANHWIIGAGYYDSDTEGSQIVRTTNGPFVFPDAVTSLDGDVKHKNAYAYWHLSQITNLLITLGLSFDDYDDGDIDEDQVNPKFGISWSATPNLTFRAGACRTFKRSLVSNQTLEPTHVAGINQFFDDLTASDGRRFGVGVDYAAASSVALGAELTARRLIAPFISGSPSKVTESDFDERLHRVYINWAPLSQFAVSLEYVYEQFSQASDPPRLSIPKELTTHQLPLTLSCFGANGFFGKIRGRYVHQRIEEYITIDNIDKDDDHFVLVDAEIGWRLPKRIGILSLSAINIFDRGFKFYGVDYYNSAEPLSPEIRPGRQILVKATLTY